MSDEEYDSPGSHASDEEDDGYDDFGTLDELSYIKHSKTVHTGLNTRYAPNWTCKEAFREVYQNW